MYKKNLIYLLVIVDNGWSQMYYKWLKGTFLSQKWILMSILGSSKLKMNLRIVSKSKYHSNLLSLMRVRSGIKKK